METQTIIMYTLIISVVIQTIGLGSYLYIRYLEYKNNYLESISFNTLNTAKNTYYNKKDNTGKY